jgi:hypothetical protein
MFFECLDKLIERDLKDFNDYDLIEKYYIYLAHCMYSIRGSINVNNHVIGD